MFISGKSILLLLLAGVLVYQQIDWDDKYDDLPRQFAYWYDQYMSGSIDFTVYNTEKVKLEEFAKQAKAFQFIEEQRDYLLRLQKARGITGSFVNVIYRFSAEFSPGIYGILGPNGAASLR
ncbi:hypothetical protein J27TS7_09250 [Paenibacillus dendritiformis]|uniref:hypothetical protein n=1 Tax=Paenibacillus dendritiformis TaxID=130049 RepID=UPI001B159147|nr:hypothetical protein [Paenibacillus dendritiformis]GIO71411.1 hypothetical protein J27TS7_09250 [Paenibacillus dendritiformis]